MNDDETTAAEAERSSTLANISQALAAREQLAGTDWELASQGFEPMERAAAVPEVEESTFGGDRDGIKQAADELVQQRSSFERDIIDRTYSDVNTGRHTPLDKVVSAEDAADDLKAARQQDADLLEQLKNHEVQRLADEMRGQAQPEQPAGPQLEPQPEAIPEQLTGEESPLQRQLRADPAFREEVAKMVEGFHIRQQQLEQNFEAQRQQMEAAYIQRANANTLEVQALLHMLVPEISGAADGSEIKGRLSMLQASNPRRYSEIQGIMDRARAAVSNQQSYQQQAQVAYAAQAAQARQQQEQSFKNWAEHQDNLFEDSIRNESPQTVKEVRSRVRDVLEKNYGIDMRELGRLYESEPWMRSVSAQRLMMDAVRFQMSREAVANSRQQSRPIPSVVKPGVTEAIPRPSDDFSAAAQAFRADPSARVGAALIAARRANRSR